MSETLAQSATQMGKGSSEFTEAAQKHANLTWLYAILAVATWYFLGWQWASIPIALGAYAAFKSISATRIATKLESREQSFDASADDPGSVVQAYAETLEKSAPAPGTVADMSKLPYPKQQIKDAITATLRANDDPEVREGLKVGYLQLANWQEGVGEMNKGLEVSSLDTNQDAKSLASQILAQSEGSEEWNAIVRNELRALERELQEMRV